MKIRYCRGSEKLTVIVQAEGTVFLFDPDEKELVKSIIEGMVEMNPEKAGEFAPILDALNERRIWQ